MENKSCQLPAHVKWVIKSWLAKVVVKISCYSVDPPPLSFCAVFLALFFAGSLEAANSSILAARRFFKEVVGKKSGFYVN